jgi:GTP-binding protein
MPATIAIIGRPNVGKSTLFNRLTGRRAALVDATPGLTRDRREGEAEIGRRRVRLIDTAGLEEAGRTSIEARMRAQSERAIAEADLVLFVVDARAGVTPADRTFAKLVRVSGKPVLLIANKCEGKGGESGALEAFALGLGEPIAISAEHGEGISELLREIAERLPELAEAEAADADAEMEVDGADEALQPDRPLKVAIVGRPNAGKSTLVNALLGEERMITGPEPGLTRDAIELPFEWNGRKIALFDTAGLRRKSRIVERTEQLAAHDALRAIRFAEVVVLLVDAERPFEKQDLQIGDVVATEGRGLVIAINKWDLVEDKQRRLRELEAVAAETLAQVRGVPIVTVSALSGRGLDKLMSAVEEVYRTWNKRVATNALNRWLQAIVAEHSPPAVAGKRLKLRFMTQPSARPPTFVIFCSRPEALPKSYLRFLTNALRETFDFPGVPMRLQLRKGDNPYAGKS